MSAIDREMANGSERARPVKWDHKSTISGWRDMLFVEDYCVQWIEQAKEER